MVLGCSSVFNAGGGGSSNMRFVKAVTRVLACQIGVLGKFPCVPGSDPFVVVAFRGKRGKQERGMSGVDVKLTEVK
jgi:hypothetical protein